jgi:ketosteroid isomerase-like protein
VKTGLLLALAWLAISVALPILEQTAVNPKTRQEIETVAMQFAEAVNNKDAAAVAAFYTEDAVRVLDQRGSETYFGRKAIEKNCGECFAASPQPVVDKLVQMYAIEGQDSDYLGIQCPRIYPQPHREDLVS